MKFWSQRSFFSTKWKGQKVNQVTCFNPEKFHFNPFCLNSFFTYPKLCLWRWLGRLLVKYLLDIETRNDQHTFFAAKLYDLSIKNLIFELIELFYYKFPRVAKIYVASILLTLFVLKLAPHKEFRFIQNAIPIICLFSAKATIKWLSIGLCPSI